MGSGGEGLNTEISKNWWEMHRAVIFSFSEETFHQYKLL